MLQSYSSPSGGYPTSSCSPPFAESDSRRAPFSEGSFEASVGGFSADSLASTTEATEEDLQLSPKLVDIHRLLKLKADQEKKLQSVSHRIDKFKADEQQVWKDMAKQQHRSLQQQEGRWRRQAQQAEKIRKQREDEARGQGLRERARCARERASQAKEQRILQNFQENHRTGEQVRQESKRLMCALAQVKDQTLQNKLSQVEHRKLTVQKGKMLKEDGSYRRDSCKRDSNEIRYKELQEEIQQASIEIAAAERDEMRAIFQLQNSRQYRDSAMEMFQVEDVEESPQVSNNLHRLQCSAARMQGPSVEGGSGCLTPSSSRHGSLSQICEDKPVP